MVDEKFHVHLIKHIMRLDIESCFILKMIDLFVLNDYLSLSATYIELYRKIVIL